MSGAILVGIRREIGSSRATLSLISRFTGKPGPNYNIKQSGLQNGTSFDGVSLYRGEFVTSGRTAAVAKKDKGIPFGQGSDRYSDRIKSARDNWWVVLYDVD